jgi:FKBP-type peptidyl-prolyl cis-trans isomerase
MRGVAVVLAFVIAAGCQESSTDKPASSAKLAGVAMPAKIRPPFDLNNPPEDAVRRPSGLVYKTIESAPGNPAPRRNDTVMIRYTGWRQASGDMFFSNMKEDAPMPLNLASTARGFTEAMQLVRKGERAMLWLPPEIGIKSQAADTPGETLVYEVEVVDIVEAPAIPADVASAPPDARTTRSGVKYVVVRSGTGSDKARPFDQVTFHVTAWGADGRMFDTTEMKKKPPATVPPFRQPAPMEEILTNMVAGERVRFWVDASKMATQAAPQPNLPQGLLCYEVEVLQIDKQVPPPPTPPDVARPPAGAKKTARGVFYKVIKAGKGGPKPTAEDSVRVHYTGWTTDGRMFDSSVTKGEPATLGLRGVIAGWTDAIPLMSVGDKYRLWIPEELAYQGRPGSPQGMLVFEVELLEIQAAAHPDMPHHP